ncbi:MAG: DUF5946 family protein [Gemmatimonadaceae bacterium]
MSTRITAEPKECEECGAALAPSEACEQSFHKLLAFEFENRSAFAEHHLTVACYCLQHPKGFSSEAVGAWWEVVRSSVEHGTPPATIRREMSARLEGGTKLRREGWNVAVWWPRIWPVTVRDVVQPEDMTASPVTHVELVRKWAQSVLHTLDRSRST